MFSKDFAKIADAGTGFTKSMSRMTFDTGGNLYVAQDPSHEILKYSSGGVFLSAFTATHVLHPAGVFFNPGDGFLYIGNFANQVLTVLKTDGTFVADDFTTNALPAGGVLGEATVVPALTSATTPEPGLGTACGAAVLLGWLARHRKNTRGEITKNAWPDAKKRE